MYTMILNAFYMYSYGEKINFLIFGNFGILTPDLVVNIFMILEFCKKKRKNNFGFPGNRTLAERLEVKQLYH